MSEVFGEQLDITTEEFNRFGEAFKSNEFRNLFFDYCKEISDPVNRQKYENELKKLESERGVEAKFVNPEVGFVIKTSVDGQQKAFINVAKCDQIDKPSSERGCDNKTGRPGLNWHIPYVQSKPKNDFDKKNVPCVVYDVVFHPDTLHLAEKNVLFKKLVVDTACDAVQKSHRVKLDLNNLKYPRLGYKGHPRPMIIRRKVGPSKIDEQNDPLAKIYPSMKSHDVAATTNDAKNVKANSERLTYAMPKYEIIHRRDIDMSEMTNEFDAKINVTIPKELVVRIYLPLLKAAKDLTLDVHSKSISLISEQPAKYKLELSLPFEVDKVNGKAQFNSDSRKLEIILPVVRVKRIGIVDLQREDSGVESDHHSPKEDNSTGSSDDVFEDAVESIADKQCPKKDAFDREQLKSGNDSDRSESPVPYSLPQFTYNRFKDTIAFTLHVKNIDPTSVSIEKDETSAHVKFSSIGSGYFPIQYAFFCDLAPAQIKSEPTTEIWDNNMIIQIELTSANGFYAYRAGVNRNDLKEFVCAQSRKDNSIDKENEEELVIGADRSDNIAVETSLKGEEVKIEIKGKNANAKSNKSKKSTKKNRSFSESHCDTLKAEQHDYEPPIARESRSNSITTNGSLKSRTLSESSNDDHHGSEPFALKSILKRYSSYDRPISECSTDECFQSSSVDLGIGSFTSIPEERDRELSESVRKTVRFDKHLCRKLLFKMNSTIIGQRKPKENKRKKKRNKGNGERRYSESEASDYENNSTQNANSFAKRDENNQKTNNDNRNGGAKKQKSSSANDKSHLMFDLEI